MKSPSLLIRLSNLIIVQIIFIFVAVALVVFWPANGTDRASHWDQKTQSVLNVAGGLSEKLQGHTFYSETNMELTGTINEYLAETKSVSHADLLCMNWETEEPMLRHLGSTIDDKSTLDNHNFLEFYRPLLGYLQKTDKPYISLLAKNSEGIHYVVKTDRLPDDAILILGTTNNIIAPAQKENAEALLLLFLVSTLISLLIVYLILKGIKEPLVQLKDGFEKVANGQSFQMENIKGDRYLRSVAKDFIRIAHTLSEKKGELEKSYDKLKGANIHLKESESILTSLVDYSPEAILVTDLEDKIIIFNLAAANDFGFEGQDMTGRYIGDLIPETEIIKSEVVTEDKKEQARDVVCFKKNREKFPAMLISTPLGLVNSAPMAKLYFIKNISESASYQEMILKLDRSASRGRMARDIAHEINNYLAILQGNIELAPLFIAKNDMEKLEKKLGVMKDTVDKITKFTEGLTRFSNETPEYQKEDLNQLIENLISFIKPQNRFDNIQIETMLADDVPLVEIDNGQIQLLLVNLIANGADALAESDGNKRVEVATMFEPESNSVRIRISDYGPGVDEDHLDDIFIKRFSTRREGSGLGLITSKNIAENHKGSIQYTRIDNSISRFEVTIPTKRVVESEDVISAGESSAIVGK